MPPDGMPSTNGLGVESPRPQADPLPSKRGEIGYKTVEPPTDIIHTLNTDDLPTSHSVDRNPNAIIIPPAQSSSSTSITKPNGVLDFFKLQGGPTLGGLRLYTLVIFTAQITFLGGTVTAWVFASKRLALTAEKNRTSFGYPQLIAVHIIFIVIILIQLVFLERLLSRLREERYNHVHHGAILPHHRLSRSSATSSVAPWNRPPLPTYAAALSQSGVATGDVEDHIIPVLPPPAYNNTRGSTLVLSALPRNSLSRFSGTGRHLSYVIRDEQRVQVQNVESVRRLEESMDRLDSLEPPSAVYIAR